jgi:hypothetical protein
MASAQVQLPNGTKVPCRLEQTISSATAEEGQRVQLAVTENVKVGDTVVIQQGATVVGTVVSSMAKRRMGRTGKLDFSIEKIRAVDGEFIPVRYTMNKREGGSSAVSTGVMTAGAAVLFWPAAPFFLLRKGKDVTINKGMVFEVFTDEDHVVKVAGAAPANQAAPLAATLAVAPAPAFAAAPPAPTSAEIATVNIVSEAVGADVVVNGAFVGSTPNVQKLAPGPHRIVVRNGKHVWERTLQVQPGSSVTVNARFGS